MKNMVLANKIKDLRNSNGFSQDELSEKTGLSLRTIQRIENGVTAPRGDSLKRLALAFNVSLDEIMKSQKDKDDNFVMIINLSQLSYLVFPILGTIIPLIIMSLRKNRIENLDKIGKAIINFQITWTIAFLIAYYFGPYISLLSFVDIKAVFYSFNLLMILMNSFRIYYKKEVYYKPRLNFLR